MSNETNKNQPANSNPGTGNQNQQTGKNQSPNTNPEHTDKPETEEQKSINQIGNTQGSATDSKNAAGSLSEDKSKATSQESNQNRKPETDPKSGTDAGSSNSSDKKY